jgi:hypothetical protein
VFPTGCDIGRGEIQEIVPNIAGVKSEAADRAIGPRRVVGGRPAVKLNQRPDRRPQRAVGTEVPQRAVREFGTHALVPEEVDLAIEADTPGQWLARVVEEGRPAHRRAAWGLAHDPDRVVPEIFFAAEPWREVRLCFSREWLDLRERHLQQACPAQGVETMVDVLSEQQRGELRQNPLPADPCEARGLALHGLFGPPIEPEAELGDEASGPQEPKRILGESLIGVSNCAH